MPMNPKMIKMLPVLLIGLSGVLALSDALNAWFVEPRPPTEAAWRLFSVVVLGIIGFRLWDRFRGIL